VYNAGNEIAVQAFLEGRLRFPEMADVVHAAMEEVGSDMVRDVSDVLSADETARAAASAAVLGLGGARTGAAS
jgi:1-deoxy-D-xylulose-5-phosphate reductoisomerase